MNMNVSGILGLFMLMFFVFHIWVLIWGYNDAEKRGQSGCLLGHNNDFFQKPNTLDV